MEDYIRKLAEMKAAADELLHLRAVLAWVIKSCHNGEIVVTKRELEDMTKMAYSKFETFEDSFGNVHIKVIENAS